MATSASSNTKDHVLLTLHAVAESGAKLRLSDHKLSYEGIPGRRVMSGVYGITSTEKALFWASDAAARTGRQLFTIQMQCALKNLHLLPAAIDTALVKATGFIHIGRLRADLRSEMHAFVLAHLERSPFSASIASDRHLSFTDLMVKYPLAAEWILKEYPFAELVVHPVQLCGSPSALRIDIGTMRVDKARRMTPRVRYLEDQVSVIF